MTFRFLGNKTKFLLPILEQISLAEQPSKQTRVVDLFCGTAVVSRGLRQLGYSVVANDFLLSCVINAKAQLLSKGSPNFDGLYHHEKALLASAPQLSLFDSPYSRVIWYLNSLPSRDGFFFREFSPGGTPLNGEAPRMYFTPENARRVDAVRETIRQWQHQGWLTDVEHAVLLHDLMAAANRIANTTGTYGFYLNHWSKSALQPFELKPKEFLDGHTEHMVILGDAIETAAKTPAPVFYLDPPYTKRQYAAYYHLLETLAYEDEPPLIGKTGSRGWKHKASDFCHKLRVPKTMRRLLESIDAKYIFVSYSEDGHITHTQMMDLLNARGDVEHIELNNSRYLSNGSEKGVALKERLYKVTTRQAFHNRQN